MNAMHRRQTSANDSNPNIVHTGIPLPATAQKRRAHGEHNAQPSAKNMRMSIAGGPGPSRPPQALAPPVPQYAPRISTYGSQPTPNPLLMSARKDQSQFGRTPMRAGTQSVRRQGFLSASWAIQKEPRPIKDRQYQLMMQRDILDYLSQQRCPIQQLSAKTLQTPTSPQFHQMFQFLITDIDDTYVFGREKKPEDEIIMILRDLRYPLVDGISKTSLAAPGSSSAWPILLGMLHWLVTIAKELPKWLDPEICQDYTLCPIEEIPFDADIPNWSKLITCDYVFNAYSQFMFGANDFKEQDIDLESRIDQKNEAVIKRCDETEIRIAELKTEIAKLRSKPSKLVELNGVYEKYKTDLERLTPLIQEKEVKIAGWLENSEAAKKRIAIEEAEIAELNAEHEDILRRIAEQGLTVEEVSQMASERDNLKRNHEELMAKNSEISRQVGDLEIAVQKKADVVDQIVGRYSNLVYATGLAPRAPEPWNNLKFTVELNTAVSNPGDMLKADMRGVIHPALREIQDARSRERAALEDEKLKADDEHEALTHQCDGMLEDQEPKLNQLQVLQAKTEELRNTVAAETAVANAEAGKLERELGSMESTVQQSEIALRSHKQRLEIEYADTVRKTEHLKDDTQKRITFECNQMLNFKQDVTKMLNDFVIYARDN